MVEINVTSDFEQWWDGLSEGEQDDVTVAVDLLEREGLRSGFHDPGVSGYGLPI